jgi:hypothetical protein
MHVVGNLPNIDGRKAEHFLRWLGELRPDV